MRCYRRLLNISYKDHVTNEEVRNRIQNAIGVHDNLLTMVKKRKLRWYGNISRSSGMAKTILQGTVKGARRRGRQNKRWEDNIKEWTGMGFEDSLRAAEDREGWKGIVATSSVVLRRPSRLRDWDEMDLPAHDVTNLVQVSQYHKIWNGLKANEKPFIYRLYNKDYFCINLYLKSGIHLTDIFFFFFCLLVAQRILYGSVKHQFMVTNIILIVQIRQK